MKISCIYSNKEEIPKSIVKQFPNSLDNLGILVGKEYSVYALSFFQGQVWYCICDENYTYWPRFHQGFLFEIIDPRPSRNWVLSSKNGVDYLLGFQEWAKNDMYYTNLVEGKPNERDLFKKYKEVMDLEFKDSSILATAEILDTSWLQCVDCLDAWKDSGSLDALVKCPICGTVQNNPRYRCN